MKCLKLSSSSFQKLTANQVVRNSKMQVHTQYGTKTVQKKPSDHSQTSLIPYGTETNQNM